MRSHCSSLLLPPMLPHLTGGGAHVHMCVIVRGRYRWWGNGYRKSLALGMWGVRPGQGMCWGVSWGLWGHLVAPCGGRPRRRAALAACLEFAFGWCWGRLVELDGDVTGGFGGAAATLRWRPGGFWVEILATVVTAIRQTGAIERRVGAVHLFLSIALHEQVDWHHPRPLRPVRKRSKQEEKKGRWSVTGRKGLDYINKQTHFQRRGNKWSLQEIKSDWQVRGVQRNI